MQWAWLSFSNHRAVFSLEAKFPKCFAQCEKKLSHVSDRKHEGTKTTWHHERTSLCLAPSMHHFLTLLDMHHPRFLHQEYTHSIQHEESGYYTCTLERTGGQSGRKSSFSQETGSSFPRGGKECITNMGEPRPSLSCHPHYGRSKCYGGCDDEHRVWFSTAGQEVMRPRRWKTREAKQPNCSLMNRILY